MASNARQYVTGGANSTLDADYLDSLTSADFLRSNIDQTFDGNIIITGNVTIQGTTTSIGSETITIADNIIELNSNVTGTPSENAGIEIVRGTSANTSILWDENIDKWTLSNDGSNYYPISTSNDALDSEQIEDIIGASVVGSGGIDVTYNDTTGLTTVDGTNVYSHPTHPGDDLSLDTGVLSGANVISDIDFNITTDTEGHVTDATLTTLTTRALTVGDIGALAVGGTAVDSDKVDGQHAHEMSWGHQTPHVTYTDFNVFSNTDKFGGHFVNGTTNSPNLNGATGYYHTRYALGSDYNTYSAQLAFGRNVTTPYISIRYEENSVLGAWQKISAGYADSAGTSSGVTVSDHTANDTNYPVVWHNNSNLLYDTVSKFTFNPSTGNLISTSFQGNLTGNVTGALTGNASTATWADTVDVNSGNSADSYYDIVWHSGDTLYSTTTLEVQPANEAIRVPTVRATVAVELGTTQEATIQYNAVDNSIDFIIN